MRLKGSIFRKVLFVMVFSSVVAGGIVLAMAMWQQAKSLEQSLIETNRLLARVAAEAVEAGYIAHQWPFDTLKEISESRDVDFLWVVKPEGEIYLADDPQVWGRKIDDPSLGSQELVIKDSLSYKTHEEIKVIVHPLAIGGVSKPWSLYLGVSLESLIAARNKMIISSVGFFVVIILLASLLSFRLAKSVTKPLEYLTEGVRTISKGNLDYRIELKTGDEIEELGNDFDQMAEELGNKIKETEEARDQLTELNKELQIEITERKRAEEELQKTIEELGRSNAELEQFAYIASHDLQEPLRMVASYTQLLAKRYKDRLDADANDFIGYAVDGAKRMQQLINDLLTYSRVGTRGKPFEPADCMTVFEAAVANLDVAIRESGAEVTSDHLPSVMADEGQLVQLFQNLIDNAVKFHGEEPPRVHVSAEQSGDEWVFSIRDNGIGIDSQYLDQAFKVFQRLHGGKYRGTGIGLSIAKRIVERHGGRIWLESQPGKGTIVHFTIPAKGGKQS